MKRIFIIALAAMLSIGGMAQEFKEFSVKKEFSENAFRYFTGPGVLLCAGDSVQSNAMTIGWGSLGNLWGSRPTMTVYVAPGRYTHEFMQKAKYFTVMTFSDKSVLRYMGTKSGRDGDKAKALGLHTLYTEHGTPYYAEADVVMECEVMYAHDMKEEEFKNAVPKKMYANFPAGIHTMYIGEIVKAMKKADATKNDVVDRETKQKNVKAVYDFLREAGVYYITTVDGDAPQARPFGTYNIYDGELEIQTGHVKAVDQQIQKNPKVCIVALKKGMEWIRINATLVEDKRTEAQEKMLEAMPGLKNMYKPGDGNTAVYMLTDVSAKNMATGEEYKW